MRAIKANNESNAVYDCKETPGLLSLLSHLPATWTFGCDAGNGTRGPGNIERSILGPADSLGHTVVPVVKVRAVEMGPARIRNRPGPLSRLDFAVTVPVYGVYAKQRCAPTWVRIFGTVPYSRKGHGRRSITSIKDYYLHSGSSRGPWLLTKALPNLSAKTVERHNVTFTCD